jgi:hypothetical protein
MFKVIKLSNDVVAVVEHDTIAVGSPGDAKDYLKDCKRMTVSEVEEVFRLFDEKNHNTADFGVWGTLTYTAAEDLTAIKARVDARYNQGAAS